MPRDEPDTTEPTIWEHPLHCEDVGSRDDALVVIQDVLRQMAARVDALATKDGARGGRVRPPTPPRGRMPAYDDACSDAGRSDNGRSSASTMDPIDAVSGGPVGPPDPLLEHDHLHNGLDAQQHHILKQTPARAPSASVRTARNCPPSPSAINSSESTAFKSPVPQLI